RIGLWKPPAELRVEHALQSGCEVPPYYDSMIAKIISHGATRDEARRQLVHGLEHGTALGVTTNQAFLAACLRHPAFAAGEATTGFIDRHREQLLARPSDLDRQLAALLLYVTAPHAPPWRKGRSLAATFPLPLRFELDGQLVEGEI